LDDWSNFAFGWRNVGGEEVAVFGIMIYKVWVMDEFPNLFLYYKESFKVAENNHCTSCF
jgi:hypothetical protein